MTDRYEYIRLFVRLDNLEELNRYGADGWRVVTWAEAMRQVDARVRVHGMMTLLERKLEPTR